MGELSEVRSPGRKTEVDSAPQDGAARTAATWRSPGALGRGPHRDVRSLSFGPGTFIQHYEIIRELGRGGMAVVYLARDTQLGRRVAIKFLAPRYREEINRLLAEAKATAQCQHENIVVIHEVNLEDGVPYIVLEYLDGTLLAHVLDDPYPAAKAVEVIVPVVRALVHAHSHGIVHRDLKPENIVITLVGTIKVLDFGIAKALHGPEPVDRRVKEAPPRFSESGRPLTERDGAVGTAPYMAPEQWGLDAVDFRVDLWAIGVILYRMVTGRLPMTCETSEQYRAWAERLDAPVPSVAEAAPDVPERLVAIIDRCLRKRKAERFADARELLDALEPLVPARTIRTLSGEECPYPGLAAFQQSDAHRFFGRSAEIRQALTWIPEHPLVSIIGPSGLGKSSFVRAGVVPALRAAGEPWDMLSIRPGRRPVAGLAALCRRLMDTSYRAPEAGIAEDEALVDRLRRQPGYLGALLRERARNNEANILVVVDQFEELYTLVTDRAERNAFTSCLLGAADDAATPIRVVVSMRADFLDRVAEDPAFSKEVTRGLLLLPPLTRRALRDALTQPAELAGYRFEDEAMVDTMVDELLATPGALSLLQFAATRLWETRDEKRKLLTRASYEAIGGIGGALASHADATLAGLPPSSQELSRTIFQRLVTPERTRAIVDLTELTDPLQGQEEVTRLVQHLVQSRLLTAEVRASESTVELVHESLIASWPTLRHWLDESQEDAAFLAQLREVARQWEGRGRPAGLLWQGDALEEARRFAGRYRGELARRERAYLEASFAAGSRSARRRRALVIGTIALLASIALGASVALVSIRRAERVARRAELGARTQAIVAETEAERAGAAERKITEQLELIRAKESARQQAETKATDTAEKLRLSHEELQQANRRLVHALGEAEGAARQAAAATGAERSLRQQVEALLARERERVKELERERGKIIEDLH